MHFSDHVGGALLLKFTVWYIIALICVLTCTCMQLDRKFRDEKRPRFGLLRCREFWMKGYCTTSCTLDYIHVHVHVVDLQKCICMHIILYTVLYQFLV